MKKIAIIGAGGMASYHVQGFRKGGADVVAICDVNIEKAKSTAKELNIEKIYSSFSEMMDGCQGIEAVSIITPNKFHYPLTMEALEKGLHVFCEKPPALSEQEIQSMYDLAKKVNKTLMFNFNNRARPESKAIMNYIKSGDVGTINSAQASWVRRAGIPGFGGWFTNKSLSGGGPVIDLLHMLDLAMYFMGYPEPAYVLARTYNTFIDNPDFQGPWGFPVQSGTINDVETACSAFITFKTGQCLMLRNSWAEMVEKEYAGVVFQGTKAGGKVERHFGIDGDDNTFLDSCALYTVENGVHVDRLIKTEKDQAMGRLASVENFVLTLDGKADPLNTPDEAVKLMKVVDALYASQDKNEPVKL